MVARKGIKPARLPEDLLAEGLSTFDAAEAARRTGLSPATVHGALKRLADAGRIFSPARGFYVIIPPEFRSWGAVPASWFVHPMMAHLGRSYYVALLSAAEMFGAAHQRPQVFQVVVDKYLPDRAFGRVRMQFVVNKHAAALATTPVNSPTDTLRVSTPEVTSLDLANRPNDSGGLNNVATVIIELFEEREVDEQGLIEAARFYPSASIRRAGYLLERFAEARLDALNAFADPASHEPAPLQAGGVRRGPVDQRWNLWVNTEIELDL
jgi:predicted transcriptional regulator of viral defense system